MSTRNARRGRAGAWIALAALAAAGTTVAAPPVSLAASYSTSCEASDAPVVEGVLLDSRHVKLRTRQDPDDPRTTWVCYQVADGGSSLSHAGRIDVSSPAAAAAREPAVDSQADACTSTPGNTVPTPHPIEEGALGDPSEPPYVPFLVDAYAAAGSAWVCLAAGDVRQRVLVPVAGDPHVVHRADDAAPAPPAPAPAAPRGYPSRGCHDAGGDQAVDWIDLQAGESRVAIAGAGEAGEPVLGTPGTTQHAYHLCARVDGALAAGGALSVSTFGFPGVGAWVAPSSDTSPCTVNVAATSTPPVRLSRSPAGEVPASVCVEAGLVRQRVSVDFSGSAAPPRVSWTPDPDTPGP